MRTIMMMLLASAGGFLFAPFGLVAQSVPSASQAEAKKNFRAYLDADWKHWLSEYPELATGVGERAFNRNWPDDSPEGIEARRKHLSESLATLKKIDRSALPSSEQLNYDLYLDLLQTSEDGLQYGDDPLPFRQVVPGSIWMPLSQMGGIQQGAAETLASMPHETITDYEDILARLEALPKFFDQNLALLKDGLKRGYSQPKIIMRDVPKQIADLTPTEPSKSALLDPFNNFSNGIPQSERIRLKLRAEEIYTKSILPAATRYHDYVANTYIPASRDAIATTSQPNGAAAYAFHIRWQTTTNLTPQQIHEIGLAEVKRIRAEMEKLIASSGFKGSFRDFTEFLRTDPRFYFDEPEDLINAYKVIAKSVDPELVKEFGKLPRNQYGVIPIPDFKAPSQTTAYYQPGAPAAGRPGYYFVNTYNLKARPKWEMEALSLHESVPGHHLQISLGQELEDAPDFRRHVGYSAFVEGWGLYAESLGEDLGLYKDPYSKFGQLTYEMWRAVRLVVDTGMHSMDWTRDQAIQFFKDNTGKTDQDITVEIDRYIAWPGQALAYKIGQLKIRELRALAEKQLGSKFDKRKFHDAVLENGAIPLNILESNIKSWIASQKN
ncbi:MAG TPA: DUF885 domain-containing protein [Candidatus Dormibacteraeota bacterium]|jgi:uncharacterized protein (DUF885 family)|nr:DUF885 domain-containing protein [Candidatus Dormibacteraeota bacterium]